MNKKKAKLIHLSEETIKKLTVQAANKGQLLKPYLEKVLNDKAKRTKV